jgi:hypothetical protein
MEQREFQKRISDLNSVDDPQQMESWFGHYFESTKPKASDTIASYERSALAIIEDGGLSYKKPYNYLDRYVIDGENIRYLLPKNYTARELIVATGGKPVATLTGAIKLIRDASLSDLYELGYASGIIDYCQQLQSSISTGNVEHTAWTAMLLQQELEHLKSLPYLEAARIGQDKKEKAGNMGKANQGKEMPFTTYVREVIAYSAKQVPPGTLTAEDVLNNFEYYEKNETFEFVSRDKKTLWWRQKGKRDPISRTILKLKTKINKLI